MAFSEASLMTSRKLRRQLEYICVILVNSSSHITIPLKYNKILWFSFSTFWCSFLVQFSVTSSTLRRTYFFSINVWRARFWRSFTVLDMDNFLTLGSPPCSRPGRLALFSMPVGVNMVSVQPLGSWHYCTVPGTRISSLFQRKRWSKNINHELPQF